MEKAEIEYEAFNKTQRIISDFDRSVRRMLAKSDPDADGGGDH